MKKLPLKTISMFFMLILVFVSVSLSAIKCKAHLNEFDLESSEEESSELDPFYDIPSYIIISNDKYEYHDGYWCIPLGETAEDVLASISFTPSGFKECRNSLGNPLDDSAKMGTGCSAHLIKQGDDSVTFFISGDVTGDGDIDSTDYLRIKSFFLGKISLENAFKKAADVDFSGEIDSTDCIKIKNFFLNSDITV